MRRRARRAAALFVAYVLGYQVGVLEGERKAAHRWTTERRPRRVG